MGAGVRLPRDWEDELRAWLDAADWSELRAFIEEAYSEDKVVPPREQIFAALRATPWSETEVVILGQDPYPGSGQATGLAFSVSPGAAIPGSLRNIHQELHDDLGLPVPSHGSLEPWACRGVLLLNTTLTFSAGKQACHRRRWKPFTDAVVRSLVRRDPVFILWGREAQRTVLRFVDPSRPTVICSPHPSPLAAWRGFFYSAPFSRANEALRATERSEIDWDLTKPC